MPRAPLDLNRAGPRELDGLPGVGPVLAGRIVLQRRRYGPFRGVDELLAVRGVGPRLLERIRPWATVGPAREEGPPPTVATPDSMAESQP
jgi:competence protein ComEA